VRLPDEDMFTVEEARRVLRIGKRQCYEAIAAGEIRGVRLGRSLRVPRQELERLLSADDPAEQREDRLRVV
jgi:excisionase family DNA binding protein